LEQGSRVSRELVIDLHAEVENLTGNVTTLEDENRVSTEQHEAKIVGLEDIIRFSTEQHEVAIDALHARSAESEERHNVAIAGREKTIGERDDLIHQSTTNLDESQQIIAGLQQTNEGLRADLTASEAINRQRDAELDLSQRSVAELGEFFERHEETISEQDDSIATLRREKANLQGVINQSNQTIRDLRSNIETFEKEARTLNETILQHETTRATLRRENANLRGTSNQDTMTIRNLRANVTTLNQTISTLNQTIGTNEASLTTLQTANTELEESNTQLEADLEDMDRMAQDNDRMAQSNARMAQRMKERAKKRRN